MTRLTENDIKNLSEQLEDINHMLLRCCGMNAKEVACDAAGISPNSIILEDYLVGVVPVTSGMGIITKFSESVADICRSLGMESFVTKTSDVTGLAEAVSRRPDIIFMADDYEFIAYNTATMKFTNNSYGTASGYVAALNAAAGGVKEKKVLVLGAGRVGGWSVSLLQKRGAEVTVADIDTEKAKIVAENNPGTMVASDIGESISSHNLILNASPAHVDSGYIREDTIISSPGVPHTFDKEAFRKATIIHDPLDIGVSAMAVRSASFSRPYSERKNR